VKQTKSKPVRVVAAGSGGAESEAELPFALKTLLPAATDTQSATLDANRGRFGVRLNTDTDSIVNESIRNRFLGGAAFTPLHWTVNSESKRPEGRAPWPRPTFSEGISIFAGNIESA